MHLVFKLIPDIQLTNFTNRNTLNRILMTLAAAGLVACATQPAFDPATVADATGEVTRIEPLSWWTGMQTPLQLLVAG